MVLFLRATMIENRTSSDKLANVDATCVVYDISEDNQQSHNSLTKEATTHRPLTQSHMVYCESSNQRLSQKQIQSQDIRKKRQRLHLISLPSTPTPPNLLLPTNSSACDPPHPASNRPSPSQCLEGQDIALKLCLPLI